MGQKPTYEELEKRVVELESRILMHKRNEMDSLERLKKKGTIEKGALPEEREKIPMPANVPDNLVSIFRSAHNSVRSYFENRIENPAEATIEISGERYLLVRAASMSKELFDLVTSMYMDRGEKEAREVAFGFMFDLAHALGKADAKAFHAKMGITDPNEKLSVGPIHFAYSGWAFVKILPESKPTTNEDFYLIYDHPFSFEAHSWKKQGKKTKFPVCIMNAGYSSGWCEESYGIPLVSVEIECQAKGDKHCRFIMASPSKIEQYLARHRKTTYVKGPDSGIFSIPEFFQRKRLEDELRKSEETSKALLNASDDRALLLDKEGTILALNKKAADAFNKSADRLIGLNAFDLFPKEIAANRREYHDEVVQKGEPVHYEDTREGSCLETTVYPLFNAKKEVEGVAVFSKDVTAYKQIADELQKHRHHLEALVDEKTAELKAANEALHIEISDRRRAEQDLEHEKKRLESLIQYSSLAIVTSDDKHRIVACNRYFEELFRFKESEIIGRDLDEIIARQDVINEARTYTNKSMKGEAVQGTGKRLKKDGTQIDVEFHGVPVIIEDKVVGSYGIYEDISDRKLAENALRESEDKFRKLYDESKRSEEVYRSLLHTSADAIVIYDMEGMTQYINPSFSEIFGWSLEELKRKRIPFLPDSEREKTMAIISDLIENGTPCHGYETKRFTKDGLLLDISISASRYLDHEGKPAGTLVILRNISERKKLESQFQAAQRMESVGTLAGGIAHDFNNLLMGIMGNASLILLDTKPEHSHYDKLKNIEKYVQNGADLTKQLLGFARGGKYEVKATDLNDIIEKSSQMFGRAKKEIEIYRKYQKNIWTVEVDQGQIEQVLLNLYVNAWQAMPGGGKLFIQTENVFLEDTYVRPYNLVPGKYVKISIADTGVGMDKKIQDRIFDPFFTTKEMARGTGLGLASAYGIIKNHGGVIDVYSERGGGTTFNIYLPASTKLAVSEKEPITEIQRGSETIMLIDDEEMIIDIGKQLLERFGYKVLVARDGREAENVYRKNKDSIDMVILDMVMPGIGGGKTYGKLKAINPKVKVLLSSGYSLNGEAKEILGRGCNGFIQKPFTLDNLSRKIHEILGT